MALPGLQHHKKFGRLVRAFGSRITAMGVLSLLWDHCYATADDDVGTAADLAYIVDWPDDAAPLVAALVASGFVDEIAPGHYRVHDLFDHCPQYVQRRRRRQVDQHRPIDNKSSCTDSQWLDMSSQWLALPVPKEQEHEEQEQRPDEPAAVSSCGKPVDDAQIVRVLSRLFHEIDFRTISCDADLKDALKTLAARYGIPYTADLIARTLDVVGHHRRPLTIREPSRNPCRLASSRPATRSTG